MLANCIMSGSHPWEKGSATLMPLVFPVLQATQSVTWTCRGGSHALVHALCSCFAYHGGRLFTGCPVDKFIMEGDAVNRQSVVERLLVDDRFEAAEERCRILAGFVRWGETVTPDGYRVAGAGLCREYPLEDWATGG